MNRLMIFLFISVFPFVLCESAMAENTPRAVGDCVNTSITSVETRLDGIPDSGSAVSFSNGLYQVGYETVDSIVASRIGDPVKICLLSIPHNCPEGDDRGRVYRTTNLRTHKSWVMPDSPHSCGGA